MSSYTVGAAGSSSMINDDKDARDDDAELASYLLRVVQQFRSIEKRMFNKYRNLRLEKPLNFEELQKKYESVLKKDDEQF